MYRLAVVPFSVYSHPPVPEPMNLEAVDFGMWTIIAILAGGIANFMLGGLWYAVLFPRQWMAAIGRTKEDFQDASPGPGMLLTLVGCFLSTIVLAMVYQWAGGQNVVDGLLIGAILGIGVAAVEGLKRAVYNFDDRINVWALYRIDVSYAIVGLMLSGVIYALIA